MCVVFSGAVREEWKFAMRRQMFQLSKSRAEEQRALERTRKMFEEEEEEEEMTDEGASVIGFEHSMTSSLRYQ